MRNYRLQAKLSQTALANKLASIRNWEHNIYPLPNGTGHASSTGSATIQAFDR
ncbi:MAG: hypothetical protein ACLPT4_07215 [Verrucomicrobiia bacterium]